MTTLANRHRPFPSWKTIKERVKSIYTIDADGHWISSIWVTSLVIKYYTLRLAIWLFMLNTKNRFDSKLYKLRRVCTKRSCLRPDHQALVTARCKSKDDWKECDFVACEKHLLLHSKEVPNPNPNVTVEGNCRFWTSCFSHGYGFLSFQSWQTYAHILSYAVSIRSTTLDPTKTVAHKCNNTRCIEKTHLYLATAGQQHLDKIANGTSSHGKNSKFTVEQVRAIKFRNKSIKSQKQVAKEYGVSASGINNIDRGLTYKWVGKTKEEDNKLIKSNHKKLAVVPFEEWGVREKQDLKQKIKNGSVKKPNILLGSPCWLYQASLTPDKNTIIKTNRRNYFTHVLSWMLANNQSIPKIAAKKDRIVIRHMCVDQPDCCNPAHLKKGTQAENMQDKVDQGRQLKGAKHPGASITEDQAIGIKRRLKAGLLVPDIAKEYKCGLYVVRDIKSGKSWKSLEQVIIIP